METVKYLKTLKGARVASVGKYQLLYFDIRGRAQAIRYLCVDNGIDLEDVNVVPTWEHWMTNVKPNTPFGQLPVLKDGDFEVPQSNTILRYISRKHGLHPLDVQDSARADMMNDHVEDMRVAYSNLIYKNYDAGKADYIKNLPTQLEPLEKLLKKWGNDFINKDICFADYNLFDLLDIHQVLAPGCLDAFPTLTAYFKRIDTRPKIKNMREIDTFKKMTINYSKNQ